MGPMKINCRKTIDFDTKFKRLSEGGGQILDFVENKAYANGKYAGKATDFVTAHGGATLDEHGILVCSGGTATN
jgi:hypothetical protein